MKNETVSSNKKVGYEYFIIETETVGVVLIGSELKPLMDKKCSITEAYIYIDSLTNTVHIKNMYIKNMINSAYSHEEYRDRVLLMTKKQINKWLKELKVKGITIVPSRAFFDKNGRFKIDICLVKGKKLYDKKDTIKDRDIKRDTDRELNSK